MSTNNPPKQYKKYSAMEIAKRVQELPRYGKEKMIKFIDVRNLLLDIQAEVSGDDGRAAFMRY